MIRRREGRSSAPGYTRRAVVGLGLAATAGVLPLTDAPPPGAGTGGARVADDLARVADGRNDEAAFAAPVRAAAAPVCDASDAGTFTAVFPRSGLITNEYAHRHPAAADARTDPDWSVTSGSLFADRGAAWSGVPDGFSPDPLSRLHTGSSVLRAVTVRRDFADTAVRTQVLLRPPGTTARTPATDWDGGHLWLRYRSPQELYALSFRRRDGLVVIKRKLLLPGSVEGAEGVYTTLAQARCAFPYDTWHHVEARALTTAPSTVRLLLLVDGRTVAEAVDTGPGVLTGPGGVGMRGDNSELRFTAFTAVPCRAP
ncbi:hypothetical protein [Streptomyces sp. NBC_00102]|uniref:hypothetical protein n=1 Tax=Streptomyces sp. NBC_00102 TaxID=2975652 RepID=UPI002255B9F4|nr:hypothetical protein [Streptomyces sp. NBC_00102]MCX5399842.1 hypothetical protein [Streptomyces sp. NBC_00102]